MTAFVCFSTMGNEANVVQLGNGETKVVNSEESGVNMEAKNVVKISPPSMMHVSSDARDEGINVPSDLTLAGTVLTLSPDLTCVDAAHGSTHARSPYTPEERCFNLFAPAVGEIKMAPRGSKCSQEARSSDARSIRFGSSVKVMMDEFNESESEDIEERLLKFMYEDLLGVIVSEQVYSVQHDTCLDEVLPKHVILDGFTTPEPLLTGIAETCPPAPVKSARRAVNIEGSLCRKLDF